MNARDGTRRLGQGFSMVFRHRASGAGPSKSVENAVIGGRRKGWNSDKLWLRHPVRKFFLDCTLLLAKVKSGFVLISDGRRHRREESDGKASCD